jgi:hypothetical protein
MSGSFFPVTEAEWGLLTHANGKLPQKWLKAG